MSEKDSLSKPIKFGIDGKRMLCWSIFAIEPIADFCPFMDYWHSKNVSRDLSIKCEFASLPNPFFYVQIEREFHADQFLQWNL